LKHEELIAKSQVAGNNAAKQKPPSQLHRHTLKHLIEIVILVFGGE